MERDVAVERIEKQFFEYMEFIKAHGKCRIMSISCNKKLDEWLSDNIKQLIDNSNVFYYVDENETDWAHMYIAITNQWGSIKRYGFYFNPYHTHKENMERYSDYMKECFETIMVNAKEWYVRQKYWIDGFDRIEMDREQHTMLIYLHWLNNKEFNIINPQMFFNWKKYEIKLTKYRALNWQCNDYLIYMYTNKKNFEKTLEMGIQTIERYKWVDRWK